jgi:hypothetical protein
MADWLAGPVNGFGYVLKPVNSRPLATLFPSGTVQVAE